jgi:hypothetical protein
MDAPAGELQGRGTTIWVDGDALMIKYSVLYYGFLGTKRVPISSISAVHWKEPGSWTIGFLELVIVGEHISPFANHNVQKQNRLDFEKDALPQFEQLRNWIQERLGLGASQPSISAADEIRKLADLLKDGLITQEEFDAQKAKLLS